MLLSLGIFFTLTLGERAANFQDRLGHFRGQNYTRLFIPAKKVIHNFHALSTLRPTFELWSLQHPRSRDSGWSSNARACSLNTLSGRPATSVKRSPGGDCSSWFRAPIGRFARHPPSLATAARHGLHPPAAPCGGPLPGSGPMTARWNPRRSTASSTPSSPRNSKRRKRTLLFGTASWAGLRWPSWSIVLKPKIHVVLLAPDGLKQSPFYAITVHTRLGRWAWFWMDRREQWVWKWWDALSWGLISKHLHGFIYFHSSSHAMRMMVWKGWRGHRASAGYGATAALQASNADVARGVR